MQNDEALNVLMKLVANDKDRCFQLVKIAREAYPNKSMQWCIEKAIYDIRFRNKPTVEPTSSPKLQRWGVTGALLNSKTEEKPLAVSRRDLQVLIETKREMSSKQSSEASRKRLFKLLSGDIEQARRLVQRVRITNPDKSEQWAVEKVIYDLERDRG